MHGSTGIWRHDAVKVATSKKRGNPLFLGGEEIRLVSCLVLYLSRSALGHVEYALSIPFHQSRMDGTNLRSKLVVCHWLRLHAGYVIVIRDRSISDSTFG